MNRYIVGGRIFICYDCAVRESKRLEDKLNETQPIAVIAESTKVCFIDNESTKFTHTQIL